MFDTTCKVINTISEEGANYKQRGDAEGAYQVLTSFEFLFNLAFDERDNGNYLCSLSSFATTFLRSFKCHAFNFNYKITYSRIER